MPWSSWKVLGLAALPLMLATIGFGTPWAVDRIEDTLSADALADLQQAGIDPSGLDIDFSYRNGTATGTLPPGVTADQAEAAVDHPLLRDFDVRAAEAAVSEPAPTTTVPAETEAAVGPVDVAAEAAGGTVVLSGTVLSEDHRDSLVSSASAAFGADNVVDQLIVSGLDEEVPGADRRIAALVSTFGAMATAEAAAADLDDSELTLDLRTASDADAQEFEQFEQQIEGVTTRVEVTRTADPTESEIVALQAELDALSSEIRDTVVFATGSDVLTAEATATLDKVAAVIDRYELPVVDVSGHTDDRGDDAANQELSQRRADSVVTYLVDAGVPAERLRARGAGETEPIDSNDTDAGRSNNRRVELEALATF